MFLKSSEMYIVLYILLYNTMYISLTRIYKYLSHNLLTINYLQNITHHKYYENIKIKVN